ncbi:OLC1v1015609C1 [Oldenlandia corymbosa var. corymbosa]|uniref:OLC1v1015609C1 n=1 Tax=Oldenlandia corymbosa var. corymbosa TaxID=529605 RepID=A0AAV1E447_OLDCO|nr:OLC1v1015609C1 [Oldenlandia corymbosa var. corymbosa]
MPYSPTILADIDPSCSAGSAIWMSQTWLLYFGIREPHIPGRVLRQFGFLQRVPDNTFIMEKKEIKKLHKETRGKKCQDDVLQRWENRHNTLAGLQTDMTLEPQAAPEYLVWYQNHTVTLVKNPSDYRQPQGFQGSAESLHIMHDGKADDVFPLMDLPEGVIQEVLYRLPVKRAAQYRLLSKQFNEIINLQENLNRSRNKISILHYSSSDASHKFLCSLMLQTGNKYDINMANSISRVWCSSRGRLLINLLGCSNYIVFNPMLSAYRIIPSPNLGGVLSVAGLGLVDLEDFASINIVAAVEKSGEIGTLSFLIFNSDSNRWRESPCRQSLNPRGSYGGYDGFSEPVYLNDHMHWLLKDLNILVFDLKYERSWIIMAPDFPVQSPYSRDSQHIGTNNGLGSETWFGVAEGCLAYVFPKEEEILVYGLDYGKRSWKKKNTIPKNFGMTNCKRGRPIFWDGKVLIFVGGISLKDVFEFDVLEKKWRKIGTMQEWGDCCRCFHPFVPSFKATLPGCKYLHDEVKKDDVSGRNIVEKLVMIRSLVVNGFW